MKGEPRRVRSRRARWTLPAIVSVAVFLAGFAWIAYEVHYGTLISGWDGRVTEAFVAFRSPLRNRVFWGATLLGNTPLLGAYVGGSVILLAAWGKWGAAVLFAAGVGLAQVMSSMLKASLDRARPPASLALIDQPGSHSLPSGHAFMTLVVAGLLMYVFLRPGAPPRGAGPGGLWLGAARLGTVVVATAILLLIGASRVYLGVHWASDVVAGWCVGAAWLIVVLAAVQRWGWVDRLSRGAHPPAGRRPRMVLLTLVVLAVLAAVVLAARADPLLSRRPVFTRALCSDEVSLPHKESRAADTPTVSSRGRTT